VSDRPLVEIALFTDDVEAVKRFYGEVAGVAPQAEWPGGAIFTVGDTKILVHVRGEPADRGPANEDHIAFGVADVDAVFSELRDRGHTVHVGPRDYDWGRSAYLRDPDGRIVELSGS
jgi:predicted enzyme related to lactoylglutathione lyase